MYRVKLTFVKTDGYKRVQLFTSDNTEESAKRAKNFVDLIHGFDPLTQVSLSLEQCIEDWEPMQIPVHIMSILMEAGKWEMQESQM